MTHADSNQAGLLDEFQTIEEFLLAASSVLKEGHMPDLTQLLKRVSFLCERLKNEKNVDKDKALERLSIILEKINHCEKELKEWGTKKSSPVK